MTDHVSNSAMTVVSLPRNAPSGAIVLFSGTPADMATNWHQRHTANPAEWAVDADGALPNGRIDIVSNREFGDFQLHLEFRTLRDAEGKTVGEGNSGIGLQGRYEIQIIDSYGKTAVDTSDCGAYYSQVSPRVNACKPAGEWQTYDIVFRAPRLAADTTVIESPRSTVFLNGILVQNNAEFRGPTGIQGGDFQGMPALGPILLQGDHDPVQFRNIWVVPV